MPNTKFTGGPWGIEQTETWNRVGPLDKDSKKVIAPVVQIGRENLSSDLLCRADADASLIACAPQMYEALKRFADIDITHLESVLNFHVVFGINRTVITLDDIRRARCVLKKAAGDWRNV